VPIKPVPEEPSETAAAIHRLKEEIDKLTLEQTEALRMAMYVGMTPDEAKEYDERRALILAYVQDLKMLEESQ
jgi:DNA-directed RNA polymerase specialized sigma24 family protein